jgi:hypothetical protein
VVRAQRRDLRPEVARAHQPREQRVVRAGGDPRDRRGARAPPAQIVHERDQGGGAEHVELGGPAGARRGMLAREPIDHLEVIEPGVQPVVLRAQQRAPERDRPGLGPEGRVPRRRIQPGDLLHPLHPLSGDRGLRGQPLDHRAQDVVGALRGGAARAADQGEDGEREGEGDASDGHAGRYAQG